MFEDLLRRKRKYWLCWGIIIIASGLRLMNTISETVWEHSIDMALWGFIAGNSWERGTDALAAYQGRDNE